MNSIYGRTFPTPILHRVLRRLDYIHNGKQPALLPLYAWEENATRATAQGVQIKRLICNL
jgi:hypothetical protein